MTRILSLVAAAAAFTALASTEADARRGGLCFDYQVTNPDGSTTWMRCPGTVTYGNSARINQNGDNLASAVSQMGDGNRAVIRQIGSHLRAQARQNGYDNTGAVVQFGTGHDATLVQNGGENEVIVQGDVFDVDRPWVRYPGSTR